MSKKDRYENDEQFEQADFNYYYFPPMFRSPEEYDEEMRAENIKNQSSMSSGMQQGFQPGMATDMMQGMLTGTGIEPGTEMGLDSGTLPGLGINPATSQMQPSIFDPTFLQGYLRQNIGKRVRVEFLIGTNILTDRSGTIIDVGSSYLVLRDFAGTRVVCDMYSVKFVNIFD
jgi:hypothetical protein